MAARCAQEQRRIMALQNIAKMQQNTKDPWDHSTHSHDFVSLSTPQPIQNKKMYYRHCLIVVKLVN